MKTEEIKSEVNIKRAVSGYLIEIEDQFNKNSLAITGLELEKIVLYGQKILAEFYAEDYKRENDVLDQTPNPKYYQFYP